MAPTDLTPRDWAALGTLALFIVGSVGAIARWSTSKTTGALALLTERFNNFSTSTSESLVSVKAQGLANMRDIGVIKGYQERSAEVLMLEFERTRSTLVDIGKALSHEMEQIKEDRIVPLEKTVHDLQIHGCVFAPHKPGNGGGAARRS